jgi:hypothetical protein
MWPFNNDGVDRTWTAFSIAIISVVAVVLIGITLIIAVLGEFDALGVGDRIPYECNTGNVLLLGEDDRWHCVDFSAWQEVEGNF